MKQLIRVGLIAVAFLLVIGVGYTSKSQVASAKSVEEVDRGPIVFYSWLFNCTERITQADGNVIYTHYGSDTNDTSSYRQGSQTVSVRCRSSIY